MLQKIIIVEEKGVLPQKDSSISSIAVSGNGTKCNDSVVYGLHRITSSSCRNKIKCISFSDYSDVVAQPVFCGFIEKSATVHLSDNGSRVKCTGTLRISSAGQHSDGFPSAGQVLEIFLGVLPRRRRH